MRDSVASSRPLCICGCRHAKLIQASGTYPAIQRGLDRNHNGALSHLDNLCIKHFADVVPALQNP